MKIKNDYPLLISIGLFPPLWILNPQSIKPLISSVNWHTIILLGTLLIISTSLKDSFLFDSIIVHILKRFKKERAIAFFLILSSALLSMIITNDIALFIVVPITIGLQKRLENNILEKLIIMEAIAVNTGSLLSPIGNPQNIYLWHIWNVPFGVFVKNMLPLFVSLFIVLLFFVYFLFPNIQLNIKETVSPTVNKKQSYLFSLLLILYIFSIELNLFFIISIIVLIISALFYRKTLLKTDWNLILLFVFTFMDIYLLTSTRFINSFINTLSLHTHSYIWSIIFSQIIGNVPTSILMTKYSVNIQSIINGVNIAANATIFASFANIIAIRFLKNKRVYLSFHKYSIPFFILSIILFGLFL